MKPSRTGPLESAQDSEEAPSVTQPRSVSPLLPLQLTGEEARQASEDEAILGVPPPPELWDP